VRHGARLALVIFTTVLALLVSGVGVASAAPAAKSAATSECWLQVVNDWLDNNRVDRSYAIPCYTQAIKNLNAYPDVQNYSSAADDIHRAMLAQIRRDRDAGAGGVGGASGGSGNGGDNGPTAPGDGSGSSGGSSGGDKGLFRSIADHIGPSDAQSIPLPLLVLGGLALLLLLTAGGTWLARRLQARRIAPEPAPKRP
jgi:hypothetical protein